MRIVLKGDLFCEDGEVRNEDKAAKTERVIAGVRVLKMQMVLWFVVMNWMERFMVIMKMITR
jgi:hypothetical protein